MASNPRDGLRADGTADAGTGGRAWVLFAVSAALAVLSVLGVAALWPHGDHRPDLSSIGFVSTFVDARVEAVEPRPCGNGAPPPVAGFAGPAPECATVSFKVLEGPDDGQVVTIEAFDTASGTALSPGNAVVLSYNAQSDPGFRYQFADRQRRPALVLLVVLFAFTVVLLGRLRGVAALLGLAASFAVLLWFTLPALLEAKNPLLVAAVSASVIAFLAIYVAHGITAMSTAALLGTLAALVLTIALSLTFVAIGNFSGLVSEEASYLRISGGFVDLRGLLLAGIVIGALGALDDMTVTQASTVWELFRANPQTSRHDLYRAGLRVGRDHVASTVNTLFLAYAGASLPLLLLFVATNQSAGNVANGEIVAVEIVRALVGSIGLVAAVPITTWLAAVTVTHRPEMPAAAVPPSPPSRFRRPFSSPAERELWEDNRSHADHTFWADHHPHDHPADHEHHLGEDPQSHAQHEVWDTHQDHHSHHDDHDQGHDDAHDDFDLGDENDYH